MLLVSYSCPLVPLGPLCDVFLSLLVVFVNPLRCLLGYPLCCVLLVGLQIVVLMPGLFPCQVLLGVVVGSEPTSWVCRPGVEGAGHLETCSTVIVGVSVVSSAFQLQCWLRPSIVVGLCG